MAQTMQKLDVFAVNFALLRVMIAGCVVAILGSTVSTQAQVPEACMAGWCSGIGSGSQLTPPSYSSYSSNYDLGAFRRTHPEVDTPENRQAANKIYEIIFGGINKALTSKGKAAALEVIQHLERNHDLTALIESESEDKYILLERLIAASISDGKVYINTDHIVNVHSMSDARWKELTAKAQVDVDAKAADKSQVDYLKNCTESPNCYGLTDEKVAKLLLTVYEVKREKRRAADEAAEAIRKTAEAARQEQARIAQQKADEQAHLIAITRAAYDSVKLAPLAKIMHVESIPECSVVHEEATGLPTTINLTTKIDTPLYFQGRLGEPNLRPDKTRQWQVKAGTHFYTTLDHNMPHDGAALGESTTVVVFSAGDDPKLNAAGISMGALPIEAIHLCADPPSRAPDAELEQKARLAAEKRVAEENRFPRDKQARIDKFTEYMGLGPVPDCNDWLDSRYGQNRVGLTLTKPTQIFSWMPRNGEAIKDVNDPVDLKKDNVSAHKAKGKFGVYGVLDAEELPIEVNIADALPFGSQSSKVAGIKYFQADRVWVDNHRYLLHEFYVPVDSVTYKCTASSERPR